MRSFGQCQTNYQLTNAKQQQQLMNHAYEVKPIKNYSHSIDMYWEKAEYLVTFGLISSNWYFILQKCAIFALFVSKEEYPYIVKLS